MIKEEAKSKKSTKYKMTHDNFFARCMANKTIAREFFESYLPKDVLKVVNLSSLRLEKSDFADKTLGKGISDVLYSVEWGKKRGYLGLLVEHQSQPDKLMTFRIMKYILRICDLYISQNSKKPLPLPPILPLVVYTGKTAYTAARSFYDLFSEPEIIKEFSHKPCLLSLRDVEDIDLRNKFHIGIILSLMQKIHQEEIYPELEKLMPLLQFLARLSLHVTEDVLKYIMDNAKAKNKENVVQLFVDVVPEKHRGHMKTIGEQFREEGISIGIEKGIEKERIAIIKNMLESNMSIDIISRATKVSPADIEKFKKSLH